MTSAAASPRQAKVELRDVSLRYFGREGETEALGGISFLVTEGEFVSIIGQSGCGKSTLLSLIAGILAPTSGTILLDGKPVRGPDRRVGYMLQQDYLFEWRTILENTVLGAQIQGVEAGAGARGDALDALRISPVYGSSATPALRRDASARGARTNALHRPRCRFAR